MQVFFDVLHTPELSRHRALVCKRFEWLVDEVIAVDATNLALDAPVTVTPDARENDDDERTIAPEDGGLKLSLAARVDGRSKHPLSAVVTPPDTHETTQFEHVLGDVALLGGTHGSTRILTFDRGYTEYDRFCELADADDEEFVTALRSNASTDLVEPFQQFDVEIDEEDVAGASPTSSWSWARGASAFGR